MVAYGVAKETGWRYTNNREWSVIDADDSSNSAGVLSELVSPEAVTDHCHRIGACSRVILWREHAAIKRVDSQHGKIISADQHAGNVGINFSVAVSRRDAQPVRLA